MNVVPYKTDAVVSGTDLWSTIGSVVPTLAEKSIVVITSKIVSICEGRIVPIKNNPAKLELAKREAEKYIEDGVLYAKYNGMLTIHHGSLIFNAGIDESNGNDAYVLWPTDPMRSAQTIWEQLKSRDSLKELGVIISDSHLIPLRWGTRGFGLAWCGFLPLNSYIGKPDIFGKPLKHTNLSMLDGLAAAAVVTMGEGNEQTPLCVITDVPFVQFQNRPPSQKEIDSLKISLEEDMYSPLLTAVSWQSTKR